jgi:tetratricopeptide (TPR) repeat protein
VQQRDPEAALPYLRRASEIAVNNSAPQLHLAETLAGLGRLDEAETEFRAVLGRQPSNPRALMGLARACYQQGNVDEALSGARAVVTLVPKLRSAHALLAEIHHRRGDTANEEVELELLPGCVEMVWSDPFMMEIDAERVGSTARIERADALLGRGKAAEALAELQAAVQAAPESFPAQLRFGRLLNETGRHAAAEAPLGAALRLRPDSVDALGELGESLQGQKKYAQAADRYREVLKANPRNGVAHFNLAGCQEKLGDRPAAIESLETALECKPEFALAHRELGRLLAESGKNAQAAGQLETALELDPQIAGVKDLLAQIRKALPPPHDKK